jgi:ATP-dependent protease ClpP protease subunit
MRVGTAVFRQQGVNMYWMARKKKEDVVSAKELEQKIMFHMADDPSGLPMGGPSSGVEVEDNKIFFYCPVGTKEVLELNKVLARLDTAMQVAALQLNIQPPPIELHIHSDGGSVFSGMAAMDFILRCKTPVHTYIDGSAASAATLMSVAGKKRFIHKNSFMLIHQLSTFVHGKFEEFKDEIRNQELLMETIKRSYKEHSKMTDEQIASLLKHDLWLDANTALEYGLVDEIV